MRLLVDAQALLWFDWDHPMLSARAKSLMVDPTNELLLSVVTLWEIAIKVSLGKLKLREPYDVFMDRVIKDNGLSIVDVSVQHAARVASLPFHHRDPFDRMLVAQATVEGVMVVSADPALDAYGIARLW